MDRNKLKEWWGKMTKGKGGSTWLRKDRLLILLLSGVLLLVITLPVSDGSGESERSGAAGEQSGGVLSSTLVNVLGGSSTTIESVFKRGLVDRSGNRIGDAMKDVFLVWDGKKVDEAKQALLQDYMLHAHNVDRMSFVKNARARLEAF